MNFWSDRFDWEWINRAMTSLPTPLSPVMSTFAERRAILEATRSSDCSAALEPTTTGGSKFPWRENADTRVAAGAALLWSVSVSIMRALDVEREQARRQLSAVCRLY
jgi:hypothetical protein